MTRPHDSLIIQAWTRLLVPVMQLFALYALVFGQYGPGGGFVGGVILATSFILPLLVYGINDPRSALGRLITKGDGLGLLIFAGVGGLGMIGGGEFLNYSGLDVPGIDDVVQRYLGILLTQAGVAADVAVTAVSIVYSLLPTEAEHD